MEAHEKAIRSLFQRYMEGQCSEEECRQLLRELAGTDDAAFWERMLIDYARQQQADPTYREDRWNGMWKRIVDTHPEAPSQPRIRHMSPLRRVRLAAAIAAMLVLGMGLWYAFSYRTGRPAFAEKTSPSPMEDVAPGGNKALLKLASGQVIQLNAAPNGLLTTQGGSRVTKIASGLVSYSLRSTTASPASVTYNTITTPRGGQYALALADGTKVWLNAASSLTFPTAFTGEDRTVVLQGEAYFEVVHSAAHPFRVRTSAAVIEDIGTRFNVMAYPDEPHWKATLVDGLVRVSDGEDTKMLTPGQQAMGSVRKGDMAIVQDADVEEATAWKDGFFEFSTADVGDIMRQISRWYDVEIDYVNGLPAGHITGKIPRHTNLSKVLEMMQLSGIRFKMEDRKVIVYP